MPPERTPSLRVMRMIARAPRVALIAACALLALAGVRAIVAPLPALPVSRPAPVASADVAIGAFAEAFARAYLSYRGDDLATRQRALAGFLGTDVDPDAGLQPPSTANQRVTWTTTTAVRATAAQRWLVTVAATVGDDDHVRYLSVPVARDRRGALAIDDYPAFVGAPAHATGVAPPDDAELTDQPLADVAARALSNYLRGARENLRADLAPGARVTTPSPPLRLDSVEALAWRIPGRLLAATVTATATDHAGARMRLRFLLTVVRRDRWYLRAVNDPPSQTTTQGATP